MNILVTGSAGFIGSCFVRMALGKSRKPNPLFPELKNGKIVSLDALTYAGRMENLEAVMADPRHVFVKGDICDRALVERIVDDHRITGIVHFAAESHVDRSIESSEPFAITNVIGTISLLDAAKKRGLRFCHISTDEVYGTLGDEGSFTEETPIEPNSPYSASKAASDCFVRAYVHTHGLDAVTTRCSNNYGPYQFPEKFLPVTILALLAGRKIPVYGTGKNVRDWLHVEDHCAGVWLAFVKGKKGEIYNLGGHGERNNLFMAETLSRMLDRDPASSIEFVTDRKGHDWRYSMDPAKAERELGWKPVWSLEEGLADLVEWYRSNERWWKPLLRL